MDEYLPGQTVMVNDPAKGWVEATILHPTTNPSGDDAFQCLVEIGNAQYNQAYHVDRIRPFRVDVRGGHDGE